MKAAVLAEVGGWVAFLVHQRVERVTMQPEDGHRALAVLCASDPSLRRNLRRENGWILLLDFCEAVTGPCVCLTDLSRNCSPQ